MTHDEISAPHSLFAIAGFAAALVAVRHHQVPEAAILEHDIAA